MIYRRIAFWVSVLLVSLVITAIQDTGAQEGGGDIIVPENTAETAVPEAISKAISIEVTPTETQEKYEIELVVILPTATETMLPTATSTDLPTETVIPTETIAATTTSSYTEFAGPFDCDSAEWHYVIVPEGQQVSHPPCGEREYGFSKGDVNGTEVPWPLVGEATLYVGPNPNEQVTATPTDDATHTLELTVTIEPSATYTNSAEPTTVPTDVPTNTAESTATDVPATLTATSEPTETPTDAPTLTLTASHTSTDIPSPTPTAVFTPSPTATEVIVVEVSVPADFCNAATGAANYIVVQPGQKPGAGCGERSDGMTISYQIDMPQESVATRNWNKVVSAFGAFLDNVGPQYASATIWVIISNELGGLEPPGEENPVNAQPAQASVFVIDLSTCPTEPVNFNIPANQAIWYAGCDITTGFTFEVHDDGVEDEKRLDWGQMSSSYPRGESSLWVIPLPDFDALHAGEVTYVVALLRTVTLDMLCPSARYIVQSPSDPSSSIVRTPEETVTAAAAGATIYLAPGTDARACAKASALTCEDYPPGPYIVIVRDVLNIRADPGLSAEVLGTYNRGDILNASTCEMDNMRPWLGYDLDGNLVWSAAWLTQSVEGEG